MIRKACISIACLLIVGTVAARNMRIGVLNSIKVSEYRFLAETGNFAVSNAGQWICSINEGEIATFKLESGRIAVYQNDTYKGAAAVISVEKRDAFNIFKIKPGSGDFYTYDDELELLVEAGHIQAINVVDADKYVAGVVEAEIGKENHPELLKCKSVICRTYALGHLYRHKKEGYDLCDNTHCQVYKGKNRFNFDIYGAVEATKGQILVDATGGPIDAVFHSNCGGLTVNSEDVWNKAVPYLRSVTDTFCRRGKHANWEKAISIDQWTGYLFARSSLPRNYVCTDSTFARRLYIDCGGTLVSLKQVRNDLGLYSTFFSVENMGDYIMLRGRGFGHGVGLCQEGAIQMAALGYRYQDIINFYYRGVRLKLLD